MAAVPFCPGFWMDVPVSGYGAGPAGMTGCFVFLWVPAYAGMTSGGCLNR